LLEYAACDVWQLHLLRTALEEFGRAQFQNATRVLSQRHTQQYQMKAPPVGITVDLSFSEVDHSPCYGRRISTPFDTRAIAVQKAAMDCDLPRLLDILPKSYQKELLTILAPESEQLLVEVVVDLHRPPVVRFLDESEHDLQLLTCEEDLQEIVRNLSKHENISGREGFSSDNRIGIPGTLHRMLGSREFTFLKVY